MRHRSETAVKSLNESEAARLHAWSRTSARLNTHSSCPRRASEVRVKDNADPDPLFCCVLPGDRGSWVWRWEVCVCVSVTAGGGTTVWGTTDCLHSNTDDIVNHQMIIRPSGEHEPNEGKDDLRTIRHQVEICLSILTHKESRLVFTSTRVTLVIKLLIWA